MTLVPADADVVAVMPDVGELLRDADTVNAMLGHMSTMELTMATSMLRGMPGMNLTGSGAVVVDLDEENPGNAPRMMMLLPVSDFEAMSQGREPVNGIVEMNMGGMPLFMRDVGGGYAAVGVDSAMIDGFTPAGRGEDEVMASLGATGASMMLTSDLFVMLNLDSVRPMIEQSLADIEAQAEMVELMAGPEAAQAMDMMVDAYANVSTDGERVMHAMTFDQASGLAADFAVQFKEGSEAAGYLNNEGRAAQHMARVPGMDFFYAAAFDFSGEGLSSLMGEYMEMVQAMDQAGMMGAFNMDAIADMFTSGAMVMGAPQNLMGGGIMTNTVVYIASEDTAGYVEQMREMYGAMGQIEQQGVRMRASLSDETVDVGGIKAYEHSMSFTMPAGMGGGFGAPSPDMVMQMMYGPSKGPAGYIAETDSGIVMTMGKDAQLLSKAVSATNGVGTLRKDAGILAAAGMLPENRVMEAYVGVDHILNTVGPMMMMFGAIPDFAPVERLTPVAMGMTADNGALMFRAVMPVETMKKAVEMIPQDAGGGMGGDDDGWGDDEDDGGMAF